MAVSFASLLGVGRWSSWWSRSCGPGGDAVTALLLSLLWRWFSFGCWLPTTSYHARRRRTTHCLDLSISRHSRHCSRVLAGGIFAGCRVHRPRGSWIRCLVATDFLVARTFRVIGVCCRPAWELGTVYEFFFPGGNVALKTQL